MVQIAPQVVGKTLLIEKLVGATGNGGHQVAQVVQHDRENGKPFHGSTLALAQVLSVIVNLHDKPIFAMAKLRLFCCIRATLLPQAHHVRATEWQFSR